MKRLAVWAALAVAGGCAGDAATKQELETLRAQMAAGQREEAAKLRSELTGIDQKYVTVQQLQMRVEKQLEEMDKLRKQIEDLSKKNEVLAERAAASALKSLEFEERLLADRLANLRQMIEELKKK
jgi:succinate dehydrogenase/fumarate reductase flavoprotein subunit